MQAPCGKTVIKICVSQTPSARIPGNEIGAKQVADNCNCLQKETTKLMN